MDKYMRMMNFSNAALSSYAEFDPEFKEALLSYANGVNFFTAQGNKPLLMRVMGMPMESWANDNIEGSHRWGHE